MRVLISFLICLSSFACFGQGLKDNLHIRFTPGVDFAHLKVGTNKESAQINFRVGGEFAFILPVHKRRWSVLLEPAYQSYRQPVLYFDYASVEIALGLRHHFYFSDRNYFFLNALSLMDVPIKHSQTYSITSYGPVILTDESIAGGFAFGGGVAVRRLSIEARYYTTRTREADQLPLPYKYGKASIIFGFRLY